MLPSRPPPRDRSNSKERHEYDRTAGFVSEINYENVFNEQLEKLRRIQEDIERRNEEERRETNNLISDMMSQTRIMMMGGNLRSAGITSFGESNGLHNVNEIV